MLANPVYRLLHVPCNFRHTSATHPSLARPLRFAAVGGLAGLFQLALLTTMVNGGWDGFISNPLAFIVSAQLNFWLSRLFTWGDRNRAAAPSPLLRQWLRFHVSIAGTALLNMAVFTLARAALSDVPASALGIVVAALANFVLGDRFIFRATAVAPGADTPAIADEGAAAPAPGEMLLVTPVPVDGKSSWWARLGVAAVAALAGVLYGWNVAINGYANEYYAAAALSMTKNLSNFFFGSLDPGGFITVDKPPVALWVQALSARLFGFSGVAILLPQAVEGVLAVLVLYHLVRRVFGPAAGLIAALVLALTPVTVAINRDNMPDALLVLLMLCAAWALLNALESARWRPLLISAVLVGVAFNTKMLQAYIVVPTLVLVYFVAAPTTVVRRITQLAAMGATMVAVSLSWPLAVDAIPAGARPFIGGSTDNSVMNLVLGYNGLGRVFGQGGFGDGGGGGGGFGGQAGWLRMFNDQLATQVSWLLPFAAFMLVAGLVARGLRPRTDAQRASFLLWGGWLVTHTVVFSLAKGTMHPYYTTAMAPAIGALCGAGLVTLWSFHRRGGWAALALPVALAAGAAWPIQLLGRVGWGASWLSLGVEAAAGVSVALLLVAWAWRTGLTRTLARPALAFGLVALLAAPAVWSASTLGTPISGNTPTAGPSGGFGDGRRANGSVLGPFSGDTPSMIWGQMPSSGDGAPPSPPSDGQSGRDGGFVQPDGRDGAAPDGGGPDGGFGGGISAQMLAYLQSNRGNARWLVAVSGANTASPIIISTGEAVMAMGGFTGSDPAPSVEEMQRLVATGELRFVLLGGQGGFGRGSGSASTWVRSACTVVDASAYGGSSAQPLYDCANAK